MAGNTRGKVKEHLEGIHRNFDWVQYHCEKLGVLVEEKNPPLTEAIDSLNTEIIELDKLLQGLYAKI